MDSTARPTPRADNVDNTPLPSYLARHVNLGFNADDVAALVSSIDSSQRSQTSSTPHLPAELLLHILEHVPVDYVLDWRLICRGFRDAIDGRILFHHLHRTQLIGYMGPYSSELELLEEDDYERIHRLRANFQRIEHHAEDEGGAPGPQPIWSGTHAIFEIEEEWFQSFRQIGGAAARGGDAIEHADPLWQNTLDNLELRRPEEGFGTLRWCIKLDHAVLDMDFPLEIGRNTFHVGVHLRSKSIRVAWRSMLLGFLKTERALRRMMEEKRDSDFTFSHAEDCLRAVRRQRLHSSLDPENKIDRHIKWSLRLLHPLFGKPHQELQVHFEYTESVATCFLLLLRREASLTSRQLAYLRQLDLDYKALETDLRNLDDAFGEFKSHLSMPGFQLSVSMPGLSSARLACNPVSWSDEQRALVEEQVGKWKSQKNTIGKMKALLSTSNIALTLPEDSFDDSLSDL